MIPVSLQLKNFTSYGEDVPTLDFSQIRLACISGDNGVGKSSLLDAITWAVWGWARSGDDSDKLVKSGKTEMSVQFEFELNHSLYRICRRRKKGKSSNTSLELFATKLGHDQWHNLTEGRIRDTQEKILGILRLSYETFTASSYLRQGNADEFTRQQPTKRKEMLSQILGLDHYDKLEEKAKEKTKTAQMQITALSFQIEEINKQLELLKEQTKLHIDAQKNLKKIAAHRETTTVALKQIQMKREAVISQYEQYKKAKEQLQLAREEAETIYEQGTKRAKRINQLEILVESKPCIENELKQLDMLKREYELLNTKQTELIQLQTVLNKLTAEAITETTKRRSVETEITKLTRQIEEFRKEGSICPTCGSELNKIQRVQTVQTLKAALQEKTSEFKQIHTETTDAELINVNKRIEKLGFDTQQYQLVRETMQKEPNLKKHWDEIIRAESALETEKQAKEELGRLWQQKKKLIDSLETSLKLTEDVSETMTNLNKELRHIETELEKLVEDENQAREALSKITNQLDRAESLGFEKERKQIELTELTTQKINYEELSIAFGKKGIQAMIIEQAIPEIEVETNNLLDKLTEGNLQVTFETQRENKSGGVVETLDIVISDSEGSRSYEMYSGGEAFRVNFAIRLAISRLLTYRAGARLQFLIMDEGFGTQDAQGREKLVEAIKLIQEDFDKILIITHVDELKDAFPQRIEVTKDATGSHYEIVQV